MTSIPTTTRRDVRFAGQVIETTVTTDAASAEAWVERVLSLNPGNKPMIVGLDCEWRPHPIRSMSNKVATLQLCFENTCVILQLFYMDRVPSCIVDFFGRGDLDVTFVGVGVGDDVAKLRQEYGLRCAKYVDLEPLCQRYLGVGTGRRMGLKGFAFEVAGLLMAKPRHVTMSDWQARTLSEAQIEYGCIDAYVSYRLGLKVISGV